MMEEKTIEAGTVIYTEGDNADGAYIVVSGAVDLTFINAGAEMKAGQIEAGKSFGELALYDPREMRIHTARAAEKTVLQVMPQTLWNELFAKCPEEIQRFMTVELSKVAGFYTRSKKTPILPSVYKGEITKITVSPAGEALKGVFKPMEVDLGALPFRIGGYPEDTEKSRRDQLHLAIASQKSPLLISRQHCEIMLDEQDKLVVRDLGSRFGTAVNSMQIGRGRGHYNAPLKKGENEILLGGLESKYKLSVKCA